MAPTPTTNHLKTQAGLSSEAEKVRGRRYFHVADTIKANKSALPQEPSVFSTPRSGHANDAGGLTSIEVCQAHDLHHRRGRRHITHGGTFGMRSPSEPSLASEPLSEESGQENKQSLGHRAKVVKCWSQKHEQEISPADDGEIAGGTSSHHIARRKGRLGFGKRHFGPEAKWTHNHRFNRIDDPGGDDAFYHDGRFTSFLGPAKKHSGRQYGDRLFDDTIDVKELHTKKMFEHEAAVHGTEDIPLGVSTQVDLHTNGFLGKSKHYFGGRVHQSSDPISDKSGEQVEEKDLSAYGLGHRGKRKYLVQNNLAAGCRHNMAVSEVEAGKLGKSASAPLLDSERLPNTTPYFQDDLPMEEQADKQLSVAHTNGKPRNARRDVDNAWSALVWSDRAVDAASASRFIEGQEIANKTDEEYREEEHRNMAGHPKRCFGNAHNTSSMRLDYNDDPGWRSDHIMDIPLGTAKRLDKSRESLHDIQFTDNKGDAHLHYRTHPYPFVKWGHGHGRKKFQVGDHLDKDNDGVEVYMSANGAVLGKVKHKEVEDHLNPNSQADDVECFFLDPNGKSISFKPRQYVHKKDTVYELMTCDNKSEDSSTLAVTGQKRNNEVIRPKSARRFPQKDTFRPDASTKSATPRAASTSRTEASSRPRWQM